ncbi:MAG: cbb3-type cytochrome oxidase subunit 3 [Noviherbaspirillum sp.]
MDLLTDARGIVTVVSLLTFLGIIFWAYSGRRAAAFDEAARLPFADEGMDSPSSSTEQQHG